MALGPNQFRYLKYDDFSSTYLAENDTGFSLPDGSPAGNVQTVEWADQQDQATLEANHILEWATCSVTAEKPDLTFYSTSWAPDSENHLLIVVTNTLLSTEEIKSNLRNLLSAKIVERAQAVNDQIDMANDLSALQSLNSMILGL